MLCNAIVILLVFYESLAVFVSLNLSKIGMKGEKYQPLINIFLYLISEYHPIWKILTYYFNLGHLKRNLGDPNNSIAYDQMNFEQTLTQSLFYCHQ